LELVETASWSLKIMCGGDGVKGSPRDYGLQVAGMATTAIDRSHSGAAERELARPSFKTCRRRCGRRARVQEAALAARVSDLEAELRAR
jgi:hypothetical protein